MTSAQHSSTAYPQAKRIDLIEDLHGHQVADPYRWLEDRDDQRTIDWSTAQDVLTKGWLDNVPGREVLAQRLQELTNAGLVGVPIWRAGRMFFIKREPKQELSTLWLREPDGSERILLDVSAGDPSGKTTLDTWAPNREGNLLAYQTSVGGNEQSILHVMDIDSGELVEAPIDRCRYSSVGWLPGGEEFFYVRQIPADQIPEGEAQFHRRVWRHRVGTDPATDIMVHGDQLAGTYYYTLRVSEDGRWLIVDGRNGTTVNEAVWIAEITDGAPTLREVLSDSAGAQCNAWMEADGRLYLLTSLNAPRKRLCVADPQRPEPEHWRELIAEESDSVLKDTVWLAGDSGESRLIVWRTRHAASELHVHNATTGARISEITLPSKGTIHGMSTADKRTGSHSRTMWFGWTDFATPVGVLSFTLGETAAKVWATAPGNVQLPKVHTDQVEYVSADGTVIRMFLISPTGKPDFARPALITGYGGFDVSRTPGYQSQALAWVQAGGVWAIASLRGGGEEGKWWHHAGRRENKQNTFDDFHAAAEYLIRNGWTTPEQLAIMGSSNGGLLVGAALTQRPELYRAAVCSAPLLDMVRYEKFLLGRLWADEYGSAANSAEIGWLLAYSPYHRVREGVEYPAVLFTVFDSDARVDSCHARKMCAALQHATSADPTKQPVLLRRETAVGHAGRSVSRAIGLSVDQLGFLANAVGLDWEALRQ